MMKLTKEESAVMISLVTQAIGTEALVECQGEEKVKRIEDVVTELVSNTAPIEMASLGPIIINKLADKVLETERKGVGNMNFGKAIELLKNGKKLARKGWNGKNMFVVYQKGYPEGIPSNKQTAEAWGHNEGDLFKVEPYLQIKNAQGSHAMWMPSIGDVLAEDWVAIEEY